MNFETIISVIIALGVVGIIKEAFNILRVIPSIEAKAKKHLEKD